LAENFNIRTVLVAPLDWGLGHATRCIPIIRGLLEQGLNVILAAEGAQATLLLEEFPALTCLPLPGYRVAYSQTGPGLGFTMMRQAPRLLRVIRQEHEWLNSVIDGHGIDLVISDNRYGLHSKKVPCVFITHQLTIKAPFRWLEKLLRQINYRYINRFTTCWVPDAEGPDNLAGKLSHPKKLPRIPIRYIGLLARFQRKELPKEYDFCILLSGPEPQRTLLEEMIVPGLAGINGKIALVRGKPGSTEIIAAPQQVTVFNHLNTQELQELVQKSRFIVSRSGYTTVMELVSLGKKAILIPTPGQTEQEYLAARLEYFNYCFSIPQETLEVPKHFATATRFQYQLPELPIFAPATIMDLLAPLA
jgi:uncharacterized protein (TIGR00661 family)